MNDRPDWASAVVSALLEHPDDTDEFEGKVFEQNGDLWTEAIRSVDDAIARGEDMS